MPTRERHTGRCFAEQYFRYVLDRIGMDDLATEHFEVCDDRAFVVTVVRPIFPLPVERWCGIEVARGPWCGRRSINVWTAANGRLVNLRVWPGLRPALQPLVQAALDPQPS